MEIRYFSLSNLKPFSELFKLYRMLLMVDAVKRCF